MNFSWRVKVSIQVFRGSTYIAGNNNADFSLVFFFYPRVPFLFRAKWQPLLVEAISSAHFIHLANRSPSALVLQLTQKTLHNIVVYFSTFLGYFIKKVGHVERKLNPQFKKWGSFHLLPVFISVLNNKKSLSYRPCPACCTAVHNNEFLRVFPIFFSCSTSKLWAFCFHERNCLYWFIFWFLQYYHC